MVSETTMADAHGYAIVENDVINVRSVSPTRRGAIVNFLITDCGLLVLNSAPDNAIELMWLDRRGTAEVVAVRITRGAS